MTDLIDGVEKDFDGSSRKHNKNCMVSRKEPLGGSVNRPWRHSLLSETVSCPFAKIIVFDTLKYRISRI